MRISGAKSTTEMLRGGPVRWARELTVSKSLVAGPTSCGTAFDPAILLVVLAIAKQIALRVALPRQIGSSRIVSFFSVCYPCHPLMTNPESLRIRHPRCWQR